MCHGFVVASGMLGIESVRDDHAFAADRCRSVIWQKTGFYLGALEDYADLTARKSRMRTSTTGIINWACLWKV